MTTAHTALAQRHVVTAGHLYSRALWRPGHANANSERSRVLRNCTCWQHARSFVSAALHGLFVWCGYYLKHDSACWSVQA